MITVVTYDEYDANYSDKSGEFEQAIVDSDILTITEDMKSALDRIKAHQNEDPERDFEYRVQFWNDGDIVAAAVVNAPLEDCREQIMEHYKKYLH